MKVSLQNITKNKLDKLNTNFKSQTNPIEQKQYSKSSLDAMSNYNRAVLNINFKGNFDNCTKEEINEFKKYVSSLTFDGDGARFDEDDINRLIEVRTPENKDFMDYLIGIETDSKGRYRIETGSEAVNLVEATKKEDRDFISELVNLKDKNGRWAFEDVDLVSYIAEVLTDENRDFIDYVVKLKDKNGDYRFEGGYNINYLAQVKNDENENLIYALINQEDENGRDKLDAYDIAQIAEEIGYGNEQTALMLVNLRKKDGTFLAKDKDDILRKITIYQGDEYFENLVEKYNRKKISFKEFGILLEKKDDELSYFSDFKEKNGHRRFTGYEVSRLAELVNDENKDDIDILLNLKDKDDNYLFDFAKIKDIVYYTINTDKEYFDSLYNKYKNGELNTACFAAILNKEITCSDVEFLKKALGDKAVDDLSADDLKFALQYNTIANKHINELSFDEKRKFLSNLVKIDTRELFVMEKSISDNLKQYFPLIPTNEEEYCNLLPQLVKSIGIETDSLSNDEIKEVENEINKLSDILSHLSDEEFKNLKISEQYSTHDFIKDTFNIVKDLPKNEQQKVFDYFGFELYYNEFGAQVDENKNESFSITGYPLNLNNGKKLAEIKDPKTKEAVEKLRPYVIKYSEDNKINCSNIELEQNLNKIIKFFPELRSEINKTQHDAHDYDLFKHSLKVVQKITQNPQFYKLNDSDKKLMLLAALFHDITKKEGLKDKIHDDESAFDSYYILKKLNLPKDEQIKLYSLIKNHEWAAKIASPYSIAFDMQYGNLFKLSKIFTEADMKAVKFDDMFFNKRFDIFETKSERIEDLIKKLKTTQPLLPVTKIPPASRVNEAITLVNPDGSTNLKGIYKNKQGLIIIKYNEVENETWEKIGFPKGSISHGIAAKGKSKVKDENDDNYYYIRTTNVDTGNIKFFAHGLKYPDQLNKFSAFALPDSDALLSTTYMERPESKYRLFKTQGVLLNTDAKYVHGGGQTDAGSGFGKDIDDFKKNYIFGGEREDDRKFISNLIKNTLNLSDKEYVKFVKENANKPFSEIQPIETRNKLIKAFSEICSNVRYGNREYNEMYVSNPEIMAVYRYGEDKPVGDVVKYIDMSVDFLRDYALENDKVYVVFGD